MSRWWPDGDTHADRIPLSALEHYAYCPRQAALIHIDGVFSDDVNTVLGHLAHRWVDKPATRVAAAPGARIRTSVPVWSQRHGLYGICDTVELTTSTAVPIEHKVGRYIPAGPADIQVAAQVVCLREMLDLDVPHGEVFSHAERRRHQVTVSSDLIARLEHVIDATRTILANVQLPAARYDSRCRRCSMLDDCLPDVLDKPQHQNVYQPRPLGSWDA
jgi:CRISPR-associated exonuclease Cas4